GSQRVALAGTFPTAPLQTGLDIFTSSGFPTTESVLGLDQVQVILSTEHFAFLAIPQPLLSATLRRVDDFLVC
ncbi:MAG: hypothetical protein NTV69_06015, partial [Caldilinea sp.]|nr:hypothetical protein [Caldilinea sp.]